MIRQCHRTYEEDLKISLQAERKQVTDHYETLITRAEAGKTHKGADLERLETKEETILEEDFQPKHCELVRVNSN